MMTKTHPLFLQIMHEIANHLRKLNRIAKTQIPWKHYVSRFIYGKTSRAYVASASQSTLNTYFDQIICIQLVPSHLNLTCSQAKKINGAFFKPQLRHELSMLIKV